MSGLAPYSLSPPPLPEAVAAVANRPAPPPLGLEHKVRISALEPERTWSLRGDTLYRETEDQATFAIPLKEITKVSLAYEPTRMQTRRYRCYLHNALGKVATIQNEHYKGFASFEDRSATYTLFLLLLISRVAAINPECQFFTGVSYLRWIANAVFFFGVFGLLIVVMFFMFTAIGWLVIVKLAIIAFFIPVVIRWFVKNKPNTFNPSEIPKDLLPK